MTEKKVKFEDIVNKLKENPEMNIYKLVNDLECSISLLYTRITENGFKGIRDLKKTILNGEMEMI